MLGKSCKAIRHPARLVPQRTPRNQYCFGYIKELPISTITEKRCMMDYFILVINKDEHITSSEFALNYDGARSDCGMKVDLYSLCGKLTRAASDYYHSNKELFEFFQYQLIQ